MPSIERQYFFRLSLSTFEEIATALYALPRPSSSSELLPLRRYVAPVPVFYGVTMSLHSPSGLCCPERRCWNMVRSSSFLSKLKLR